ncbi:acyltransferase [Aliterella atlantica CENA595]|uniref:Acyltransferase n=1 Tax=Aliterella atlantica CENA595 TaxID=1618023 RepID=A0A0D8ZUD4_9CYAN|nr:acyltransferase [Aliterella atlantica CENA595]
MQTAILTPLEEELSALVFYWEQLGLKKQKLYLGSLEAFEFSELGLLAARGGHGKAQFGIQSQFLLCQMPQIELLVCAGAAGALSNMLAIGDIVVASETIEHDYNLKFVSRPLPRFLGDPQAIAALQSLPAFDFQIQCGAIASGDEDIVTVARGKELKQSTGCIAVAWEGAGGARACNFSQKRYIELRGITDTANCNAAADFAVNLTLAMSNLAQAIAHWQKTNV